MFRAEVDVLALELAGSVLDPVVNQVTAGVEVLVMGENESFAGGFTKVLLHPKEFIAPGGRVFPWRRGKNVGIEDSGQFPVCLNGSLHGRHE